MSSSEETIKEITTSQKILDAVITCIDRWGVDNTSLNDIARDAGVSRKTIYSYYENREQLIIAAIEHKAELYVAEIIEFIKQFETPEERLVEAVICCMDKLVDDTYIKLIKESNFSAVVLESTFESDFSLAMHDKVMSEVLRGSAKLEANKSAITELVVRLIISMFLVKSPAIKDQESLRQRLQFWLLPMLENIK